MAGGRREFVFPTYHIWYSCNWNGSDGWVSLTQCGTAVGHSCGCHGIKILLKFSQNRSPILTAHRRWITSPNSSKHWILLKYTHLQNIWSAWWVGEWASSQLIAAQQSVSGRNIWVVLPHMEMIIKHHPQKFDQTFSFPNLQKLSESSPPSCNWIYGKSAVPMIWGIRLHCDTRMRVTGLPEMYVHSFISLFIKVP